MLVQKVIAMAEVSACHAVLEAWPRRANMAVANLVPCESMMGEFNFGT